MRWHFSLFLSLSVGSFTAASASLIDFKEIQSLDQSKGLKSLLIRENADVVKDLSAQFDFQNLAVEPGEVVYLKIPAKIAQGTLDFVSVSHRQDANEEDECPPGGKRDCQPAYTSVEVYSDSDKPEEAGWRCWGGVGSGPCHSKFAEVRARLPETDNLYEWLKHGHLSADTKSFSKAALQPRFLRVRNLGTDRLRLHQILVKILPPVPTRFSSIIFSNGFHFGDYATSRGRRYPGNPSSGDYGNALFLDRRENPRHPNLPAETSVRHGSFEIPLDSNGELSFVDLACGDMQPVPRGEDPEKYRGAARVTVEWIRNGKSIEVLMNRENVGESGVMRASPSRLDQKIEAGDRLRVQIEKGSMSIMAIQMGYMEGTQQP